MNSTEKQVSIVIINYNTFALTSKCIESIFEKTKNVTFEVILVDNASVERDPEEFKTRFPEIVLLKSETNLGFAKGCNLGIAHATSKYVLLLNSDTELLNDAVSICKVFLDNHPKVAVVSSRLEYPDGSVQNNCQRFPSVKYGLFELFRLQKILPKKVGGRVLLGWFFDCDEIIFPDWVWGTFFMFEKSKLQELPQGKLADDFFMYVEDMQWCKDFRLKGYEIALEPAASVVHFVGKSGAPKASMMLNNTEEFLKMYYSTFDIFLIKKIYKMLTGEELTF